MKVKLLETVQGAGINGFLLRTGVPVNILEPNEVYDVDSTLGAWLVENHKAEAMEETPLHYGAQAEAELRQDDVIYEQIKAEADAEALEIPEESDMMTTDNQPTRKKRTRK